MENFHSEVIPEIPPEESIPTSRKIRQALIEIIETLLLSLFLYMIINSITARIRVESISMQPTLQAGYYVIVNKLAYKLGHPTIGDIVVFRFPPEPTRVPYIKRVIGLPNDEVKIDGGVVYVNNKPLIEPYIAAPPSYNGTWIVPENSLFVLGDNRNRSSDSHEWGMVPIDNVIGKGIVIYWPPSAWRVIEQTTAFAAGN